MKKIIPIAIATAALMAGSTPAFAASQNECAIWLCLPGGFPGGCEAAHAAFIKRITHKPKPKPPLPAFSSCSVDDGNIAFDWGFKKRMRCKNPEATMRQGDGGTLSCRIETNNEDGYLLSPVVTDHIVWTDVPSLGKEHRNTEYVWRTTGASQTGNDRR